MGVKQPGEAARLTYDTTAHVLPGDVVQTLTGRMYLVQSSRVVQRRTTPVWHDDDGQLVRRWALATVVLPPDHVLDHTDTVHELHWYRR